MKCGVSIKIYTNKLEFDNGFKCINVLIKASTAHLLLHIKTENIIFISSSLGM